MSLKTAAAPDPLNPPPGRHRSIGKKLALLHILAVFISCSVCASVLYGNLVDHMGQAGDRALTDKILSLRAMLQAQNGMEILAQELRAQLYEPDKIRSYIRIIARDGRIIAESRDMKTLFSTAAFPPPVEASKGVRRQNFNGDSYLMRSITLADAGFANGGVLQIAMPVNQEKAFAGHLRLALVVFVLSTVVFAVPTAAVIVRRGLKPLKEITEAARHVSTRYLHTRIDLSPLPREMVSLGNSFNSMLDSLQDSLATLSQYTANLAHELRTPINRLMTEAEITLSLPRTEQEYQRVMGSNLEEYHRLSLIINKLLFLARADGEQKELVIEPMDVNVEIEEIADFYSEAARDAGVELVCEGQALLSADLTLFHTAISNLVANALKFTPPGGRVVIAAHQADDLSVEVAVSDSGCGIPQEHLPMIFDRFYRACGDRKDVDGSGLGLAIVKAIMLMHGGTVEVRSEPDIGSTFTLRFRTDCLLDS